METITEQYLDNLYDNLTRESSKILTDIKTDKEETKKVADLQKQFAIINTLMMNVLKLRNLRQKIKKKMDGF
jgi:hypothetical protein